jgi:hypothetical protein
MKRVLAALPGHRSGGHEFDGRPSPRKNRAARRQAGGTTTESHDSSTSHAAGRQARRPCAGKASCRCPARSPPQPPAAQAAERERAQQGQGVGREDGQRSRQAQDKRTQEEGAAAPGHARRKNRWPEACACEGSRPRQQLRVDLRKICPWPVLSAIWGALPE